MKQILLFKKSRYLVILIFTLIFAQSSFSQQLKRSHDESVKKGHQLYKQTKIYDNSSKSGSETKPRPVGDKALDRIQHEFNMLKNPYTQKIPNRINQLELEFTKSITQDRILSSFQKSGQSGWKNRGPFNVGGRTRALAIDRNNENIILAGGVSGGLWRSEDAGQSWKKVTANKQSPSITCIVQHPDPNKSHIWYYGSGERSGNSASAGGAFYTGGGIYISRNNGVSWRLLRNTEDNNLLSVSPFEIVNSIDINPVNGDLYVATFNGVHRSKDKGNTFEEVLVGGFDNWTEVMITPKGKIYATVHFFGTDNFGLYASDDGDNWTRLSDTAPPIFNGRTVMTYDPSDENIVYFFAESLVGAPYLLKYNNAATNPADMWTDLSANLPNTIGGRVGSLNLQGRYNMFIRVKPDDPNFIVLGGTNIYKSTTGFMQPAGQESWIGGYSPLNDVSVYPDHHPDQHNFIFYPSNPNRALSANDGGVQVTENITSELSAAEPVDWISLNQGYLTTQPYAVSFDPQANSDDLLAGFQDNGSWYTNSTESDATWVEDFGGDGSYNAIADGGLTRYVSSQFANIYRLNFDNNGNILSFARIRPAIASNPSFIAPFILDPNNDNIMYLPDNNRILRNNDLDAVPGGTFAFATVNWVDLPQTTTPDNSVITALDVSRFPVANRLYYGTSSGMIYRMDNANLDNQEVVDISTGKGLPPGNINNISVDPSDENRAIVVFSNYGIPSVFITENAGESWTDISGNLEENTDGSGNGPSVRWSAFYGNKKGYFVGTSAGLYFTTRLSGNNTKWKRNRLDNISGTSVISQVKTRKDGFVALAVHGNGLLSAKFPLTASYLIPESTLSVAYLLDDFIVDLNSADTEIDISGLFESTGSADIQIEITNSNPDIVTAELIDNTLVLSYAANQNGKATIGLIATSGNETVSEGFTVTVVEPAIYEQIDALVGSAPSQNFLDFGGLVQSADDFVVPEGSTWSINRVLAFGVAGGAPVLDNATVVIYENDGGKPGLEVYNSGIVTPESASDDSNLNIGLPTVAELTSGSYWLAVYSSFAFAGGNQWFWSTQGVVNGSESFIKDEANLFQAGAVDWTSTSTAFGRAPADQVFQLFGVSAEAESTNNTSQENSLATLNANSVSVAWPNPSTDQFRFNVSTLGDGKASIRVHNLTGKLVYEKKNLDASREFNWNASKVSSGIYFVVINGDNFRYTGKLIKK